MNEKARMLILFREMAAEKFLEDEINIALPRSSLLSLVMDFKETYGKDLLAFFEYQDLAEIFAECASIYTAQSLFRYNRKKDKFYIASSSKHVTPAMIDGARRANYRHHQMLGDDY